MMLVIAALLLAIGMMGAAFLVSQGDYAAKVNVGPSNPNIYTTASPPEHPISVSASATQKVAPDLLEMSLRVQTKSTNAREAQQENARVSAILLGKLKALGVADKDIQTVSYSVDPVYESAYNCDKSGMNCHWDSNLTGYQAVQSLNVDIEALDNGGAVIDAASESGDNETFVDSASFTLKPETRTEMSKALLKEAAKTAKAKAGRIADGLGITLGKVLSASENSYYQPYYYNSYEKAAGAAVPAATQLSPGQVEMSVSVGVSYEAGS
jgi:uncharacterized protein YggE